MNKKIKTILKVFLAAFAFFILSYTSFQSVDIKSHQTENTYAEKPLFGADEFKYDPAKIDTPEKSLENKIKWGLLIFVVLLVLVIASAFDIAAITSKITGKETLNGNKFNSWLMLIFMIVGLAAVAWEYKNHGKHVLLGNAASEHGATYDSMFQITLILTTIVFVITQFLLFWFAFKYTYNPNRKALYYSHNNKLEVFWTIIPAIVLTILVLRGHKTWNSIMYAGEKSNPTKIEIFAYQFGWNARYAGKDGELGKMDYKFISESNNKLGLGYEPAILEMLVELDTAIVKVEREIQKVKSGAKLAQLEADYKAADDLKDYTAMEGIEDEIETLKNGEMMSDLEASLNRKKIQKQRVNDILKDKNNSNKNNLYSKFVSNHAEDDVITQELHLVKGQPVTLLFRSRDIIHSAWLPHFRAQMNVVPGLPTKLTFIPTKTTAQAKAENGEEFEFYLYCNKICGTSHYGMKLKVVVEEKADYEKWLAEQPTAFGKNIAVETTPATPNANQTSDSTSNKVDSLSSNKKLAVK